MICGCGFVLWCSVGLFYGGCGFVSGAMLALDCVFFFGSATRVCGCGWWADGGVGICGFIGVGFGSVGGSVGLLPGFFYFYFFGVDSRLWVGGGGGGGVRCV